MIIASLLSNGTSVINLVGQVEILILLLIVTLIVALLARLMRIPYTLLLVIIGFIVGIVGLLSFLPHEHLDPNVVLYIFIPALLFEGAWNAELDRLEAEWLPIILLAIPGMVLSLLVVAVALHVGIGLEWLLALLVGAIVAPTDPIAVIALFQQLGVPDRLRTLVEGKVSSMTAPVVQPTNWCWRCFCLPLVWLKFPANPRFRTHRPWGLWQRYSGSSSEASCSVLE